MRGISGRVSLPAHPRHGAPDEPLRIMMFCSQFHPLVGGAERQAEKLARALMRAGLTVEVLTFRLEADWPLREDLGGLPINRFDVPGFPAAPGGHRGGAIQAARRALRTAREVRTRAAGFHLLHTHMASTFTAAAMEGAHAAGLPVICKIGSTGPSFDLETIRRESRLGGPISRRLVSRMDRWVATTGQAASELAGWGVPGDRVIRIPNGVEIPGTPRVWKPEAVARRFLYLGRLAATAERDIPCLLAAFDRVADSVSGASLALVGDGDQTEAIRRLAEACRNRSRVTLPGRSNPESWFRTADCFVLPSRVEGMSNALLEAMANGLACVANDIPPNREMLDEGRAGILVPVGDVEAMTTAMLTLATVPGELRRLGMAARLSAERCYSIEAVAARHVSLYRSLLSSGS